MILLEVHNQAVVDILSNRFETAKEDPELKVKLNYTVADFDGVTYHISDGGERRRIFVSIFLRFFEELRKHGVEQFLRQEYGDLLSPQAENGQSVTLSIDLDNLPDDHLQLARRCALLKRNCIASVFYKFFDLQAKMDPKSPAERAVIHYRTDETLYIQALHDRVTVIFSTLFKDPDDMLIGKVFVQEFTESRRRIDRAPQVLYSYRVPPAELQGTDAAVNDSVAYVTFVLNPRHIAPGSVREKSLDLIHTLRNYLHYHIKCSKAYIQMRMRAKTIDFLKIINRAHLEKSEHPVINVSPTGDILVKPVASAEVSVNRSSRIS